MFGEQGFQFLGRLRPCLIRPEPDLGSKFRILKPYDCKQTETSHVNPVSCQKCEIWIWFWSKYHNLSLLWKRMLTKCRNYSFTFYGFYGQIMNCELIEIYFLSFYWQLSTTAHHLEFNDFGKSGLNKYKGFWNRYRFWSNQTLGPPCVEDLCHI